MTQRGSRKETRSTEKGVTTAALEAEQEAPGDGERAQKPSEGSVQEEGQVVTRALPES